MQKLDTISNISKMDMERQGEFNEALRKKLSYEWKNIYRSLLQSDVLQKGSISVSKFNQVCVNHGVILSKEEVRRLVKIGSEHGTQQELSNFAEQVYYVRLSKNLGLHKNALNLMQGANNLFNDTSAVKKLK